MKALGKLYLAKTKEEGILYHRTQKVKKGTTKKKLTMLKTEFPAGNEVP
jgi:hypothetical protein